MAHSAIFSLRHLLLGLFLIPSLLWAATIVVVVQDKAAVYTQPNATAPLLGKIPLGLKLKADKRQGDFIRVIVKKAGQSIPGWIKVSDVKKATAKVAPAPQTQTSPMPASPATPSTPASPPPNYNSQQVAGTSSSPASKGKLSLDLGYRIYNYKLVNGGPNPGTLFSVNLPGYAAAISYERELLRNDKLYIGAKATYRHIYYLIDTNLQDDDGLTFKTEKTTGHGMEGELIFPIAYTINPKNNFQIGAELGAKYVRFDPKDVESDTGRIFLYTTTYTLSAYTGLFAQSDLPWVDGLSAKIFGGVTPYNYFDESPEDTTGLEESVPLGIHGGIEIGLAVGKKGKLSINYLLMLQDQEFEGQGSRVGLGNTSDATAETSSHLATLRYSLNF